MIAGLERHFERPLRLPHFAGKPICELPDYVLISATARVMEQVSYGVSAQAAEDTDCHRLLTDLVQEVNERGI